MCMVRVPSNVILLNQPCQETKEEKKEQEMED